MPASFDNNIIYKIQQANDIVEVISEHLRLDKKGREYLGLCPFHDDHSPSMHVSPTKQIYKCFACGAGGDVIKFIQTRENLTFPQALKRLADRAGIEYQPRQRKKRTDSAAESDIDPQRLAEINKWAARLFRDCLNDEKTGKTAREYLAQRQINLDSIKIWGLGYAPEKWDFLREKAIKAGICEPELVKAGLAVSRQGQSGIYDKFRNRLMFPILDVTGRVTGFGGRTLGDDPAKYMNSPATILFDKSNELFGLYQSRLQIGQTHKAVVVEGYTDVIMAHQNGCKNVVATLGTSFTSGHARILKRYAKNIILVFDSDIAGTEAANRALDVCVKQKIDIKLAFVPEGKDPCDFILTSGPEAFNQVLENAEEVLQFKWKRLEESFNTKDSLVDRRNAIDQYLTTISPAIANNTIDSVTLGLIIKRLSELSGMDSVSIQSQLKKKLARESQSQVYTSENQQVTAVRFQGYCANAQKEILEVLLAKPQIYNEYRQQITASLFTEPVLQEIVQAFILAEQASSEPNLANILANIGSSQAGSLAVDLAEIGSQKGNYQQRLNDALKAIQEHNSRNKIRIEEIDDETEMLKIGLRQASKSNSRNIGMM